MKRLSLFCLLLLALVCGRTAAAEELTRIYRGEDGGALYTRSDGATFIAFAEHPGQKYAFVMKGEIKDNVIDVDWWDVPKGTRKTKGSATLKWSQEGKRIVRTGGDSFGPATFMEINPNQVPWPPMLVAGFQGKGADDLNGAFDGQDHSRWYIRETPYNVVGIAEAGAQPGERPKWTAVFFAKRTTERPGSITGTWFDVAKGLELKNGAFNAVLMTPSDAIWGREMTVQLKGAQRSTQVEPDYAIDYTKMAQSIEQQMKASKAVGWGYAIAGNGTVLRKGAGGYRQLQQDGGTKSFTPNTMAQAASFTKLVSAVTLAKALHDAGHDFDDKVGPFLPKCWKQGTDVRIMTFGDIASHHTGFTNDKINSVVTDDNLVTRVRMTFELGRVLPLPLKNFDYQNINYEIMRYLIPLVARHDKTLAIFEKYDCKDDPKLNEEVSKEYNDLVFDMLAMANVQRSKDAAFLPRSESDYALLYNADDLTVKGRKPNPESPIRGGAGYLALSAYGAGKFLAAFDNGEIVPMSWARTMKHKRYGFDSWKNSHAGRAMWKNGGCPTTAQGHDCATWGMVFPGHVEAYVAINSAGGLSLGDVLFNAYQQAFK